MLSRILKPFTYWKSLYKEFKIFFVFRKTAFANEELLETNHQLRVDWLGRIYGVINIPEEVQGAAEQIQQAYVFQQIANYGKVMNKIGLSDIVYPEFYKIDDAPAYLVVLWPEYGALTFWKIIGNIFRTIIITFLLYLGIRLLLLNFHYVTEFFSKSLGFINSLM